MRFIKALTGLLVFCTVHYAWSQPCNIHLTGRITDLETGEGLSFATILLKSDGLITAGAVTDEAGLFIMKGLCRGAYTLESTHIGCEPVILPIRIKADTAVHMIMDHRDTYLEEFVLLEPASSREELTRLELRKEQIEQFSGIQLGELAALLPGVRVLQTGNTVAKPVYRGLHSNRLLVMNNGIRHEGQYWGSEHAPEIDPYSARGLAIIEGVDALRYAADAIGGVLLVEPGSVFGESKPLRGEFISALQSNGRGGSGSVALYGLLHTPLPLYYRIQGSAKALGNVRTPDSYLTNTGTREYNLSYALGTQWRKWEAEVYYTQFNQEFGLYRYSHLGNLTDLYEVLQGRPAPDTTGFTYRIDRPRQEVLHELVKATLKYNIETGQQVEVNLSRQYNLRQEYDVHVGFNPSAEALAQPQLDYRLRTWLGEALWHHEWGAVKGTAGVSGLWRRNFFRGRNFMPSYRNSNLGAFLIQHTRLWGGQLRYGLRYDWYSAEVYGPVANAERPLLLDFSGGTGAIAFRQNMGLSEMVVSLATHWRPPAINEMFSSGLHHGAGGIEEGNPDLIPERSVSLSATLRRSNGSTTWEATGYANYIANFIYMDPNTLELTIRGAFPRYDFMQADAMYTGVDASMSHHWSPGMSTTGRASLVWAHNLDEGTRFIGIPAHRFETGTRYTFRDRGKLKRPFAAVRGAYTLRQYREPGLFPFGNVFGGSQPEPLPPSFDFAPAPDAYFLLGAEVGVVIGRSTFALSGENILNKTYRDYMNRFRYYADEMGRNVVLRYKLNF